MRSEKDKMLAGELYNPADPVLLKEREETRRKVRLYNHVLETDAQRLKALKGLFGSTGEHLYIEPNLRLDYGYNIHVGESFSPTSTAFCSMFVKSALAITVCLGRMCRFTRPRTPWPV